MAEPRIQQTFSGATGMLATLADDRVLVSPDHREAAGRSTTGAPADGSRGPRRHRARRRSSRACVQRGHHRARGARPGRSGLDLLGPARSRRSGAPFATGDPQRGDEGSGSTAALLAVAGPEHPEAPGRVELRGLHPVRRHLGTRGPHPTGCGSRPTTSTSARTARVFAVGGRRADRRGDRTERPDVNDVATGALLMELQGSRRLRHGARLVAAASGGQP